MYSKEINHLIDAGLIRYSDWAYYEIVNEITGQNLVMALTVKYFNELQWIAAKIKTDPAAARIKILKLPPGEWLSWENACYADVRLREFIREIKSHEETEFRVY